MTRKHRLLSWLLLLSLLVTLLPLPLASAAGTSIYKGKTYSTDYTSWSQGDPAWGQTALGDVHTLAESGSLVSSIAILMCYSGAYDPAQLNPGILRDWFDAKEMISHSSSQSKDALLSFGMMTARLSPRFYYASQENLDLDLPMENVCAKINWYHNNGYQVVARVKDSGHYVAVGEALAEDAVIYDPGTVSRDYLSEYLGTISGFLCFKADPSGRDGIMIQFKAPDPPTMNRLAPSYGTGDRVVISWQNSELATHYNIIVDMQRADGSWQSSYKYYPYVKSPATLEALPAGTYRVAVQAGNASTSPWSYASSPAQSFTVQANFLTVTYDPNGGSVSPSSQLVGRYSTYDLPTPARDRYAFIGWYTPSGDLVNRSSRVGSFGITLTARWDSGAVGFSKNTAYSGGFKDVARNSWYYDSVASVFSYGLMDGVTADTFCPGDQITAAQAVTLAARMRKLYFTGSGNFPASDPWYQTYLDYALNQKIIQSAPSNMGLALTRQEFATILAGALPDTALPEVNELEFGVLPDVYRSDAAIYKLYRAGILTGSDSKGTFRPNSPITRAEVAAILVRMADPNSRELFALS